ncbi:MAG: EthD domain-containing protein [Myxococcota bacterium]|nr:EthD domain-containing protein [Myxococcota bacterium]
MVKLVYCIRRRPDVSPDAFRKHWLEVHAPKVEQCAKALRARRYVQSHTLDSVLNEALRGSRGARPPYDGITEVWWDSEADLAEAMRTEEGAEAGRALLEDEQAFIHLDESSLFLTEEHAIF